MKHSFVFRPGVQPECPKSCYPENWKKYGDFAMNEQAYQLFHFSNTYHPLAHSILGKIQPKNSFLRHSVTNFGKFKPNPEKKLFFWRYTATKPILVPVPCRKQFQPIQTIQSYTLASSLACGGDWEGVCFSTPIQQEFTAFRFSLDFFTMKGF
jgi:hypothetical protein